MVGVLKEEASSGLVAPALLTGQEGLNDFHNLLLLAAWEPADCFKDAAGSSSRAVAALACLWLLPEKEIHADLENAGEFPELLGLECRVGALPSRVALLGDAEGLGDLRLSEPELLAGLGDALAELGALGFGRTARDHVGRVNRLLRTYGKCVHNLQAIA